ncbi:SDR family NAD(P)-dependent oxidoreductase [Niastella sp. OAS944]|uniref:SDR family NAD(P)-dependent oxidoreductase n=1 Tax=Niastella sp. OAS944 TaxID=2664089 RepID=UPI003493B458|nr:acyl transferase domain-containing protein/NADPH:quinone reductase-like Zn-dependent oxidoreductase/acyl carrier protein [Chitinophagaceae bacterium OAS944]
MNNSLQPIAIVGMGCRLPGGAASVQKFWELMLSGTDAVTNVPAERWSTRRFSSQDEQKKGKVITTQGGFLHEKIDEFDPLFFGISPREAESLDPQQRLLLEVSYEATEDAGLPLNKIVGSNTGVFIGGFTFDNGLLQYAKHNRSLLNSYTSTGVMLTMLSSKLSYWYNLKGPSMTIDTACSSSLVAIHLGAQSIWNGESDMVMAGGVNVMLRPDISIGMSGAKLLSKHGRCKAFDEEAAGYVRGEGAAIVILKPYDKAIADNDRIYALLRATGVNQDGRTNGITTPNAAAQKELIKKVYTQSGLDVKQIDYIEAHGTGTQVGDTIEFNTINEVLKEGGYDMDKCLIGSVKTNIGHLEAGAGVAGFIKTALCLYNKQVPPNLHFKHPNPRLDYTNSVLKVPVKAEELPKERRSLASINSFGYGGTNAHAVLQEYRPNPVTQKETVIPATNPFILPLSAHSNDALKQLALGWYEALANDSVKLNDLLYTAALRRTHHPCRLAIVAESKQELLDKLNSYNNDIILKGVVAGNAGHTKNKFVFVYTGMGPQWWKMGRELLEKEPVVAESMKKFDTEFQAVSSWSILEELKKDEAHSRIKETQFAQPGNFIIQFALTEFLTHLGIVPDAVVGHSVGEAASAYFSGALSLKDAITVIYHRSRLQGLLEDKGRMLAVSIPEEEVLKLIAPFPSISIAAVNSPGSVTLSGDENILVQLADQWEMKGIFCRMLEVSVPYHSPVMDEIKNELLDVLKDLNPHPTYVDLYSTVTGNKIEGTKIDAEYWWNNVRQPVSFAKAVNNLVQDEYTCFVEIGPHPVLKNSILECLDHKKCKGELVHFLNRKEAEQVHFYTGLATLFTMGYPMDWAKIAPEGQLASLPAYTWQRSRYWNESIFSAEDRKGREGNVFLNTKLPVPHPAYEVELSPEFFPFIRDHVIHGKTIFPGAGYIAAAIALYQSEYVARDKGFCLEDVSFHQLLQVDNQRTQFIHAALQSRLNQFSIHSRYDDNNLSWQLRASGRYVEQVLSSKDAGAMPVTEIEGYRVLYPDEVYSILTAKQLSYGPQFRVIKELVTGTTGTVALLQADDTIEQSTDNYFIHPVLLDGCFQAVVAATSKKVLPVSIQRLNCYAAAANTISCAIKITKETDNEVTADLSVYNADGNISLFIEGLKCQSIVQDTQVLENEPAGPFYIPYWEEVTATDRDEQHYVCFVLGNSSPQSGKLIKQFLAADKTVVEINVVSGNATPKDDLQEIDLFQKEAVDKLARRMAKTGAPVKLVYLAGMNENKENKFSAGACTDVITPIVNLVQSFAALDDVPEVHLYILTSQAQVAIHGDSGQSLMEAPLWALGAVIENEHPQFTVKLIDLDDTADDGKWLGQIFGGANETAVAVRNGKLLAKRLKKIQLTGDIQQKKKINTKEHGVALRTGASANYKDLYYEEILRKAPLNDEVEIKVSDAGINFKDYLKITGQISRKALEGTYFGDGLSMECAGVVTRTGAKVTRFKKGDKVLFINPSGSFQSFITTKANEIVHRPAVLNKYGSHVVIAFLTVFHCLKNIARLSKGEKLLIHNATGAVGLAAIQYAQWKGAQIFATAGNEEKRDYLRSLGVQHIYNSHDLQFVKQVMTDTEEKGVDVILSAMQGEVLLQGLSLLAPYGRYIEIGKKDIADNAPLPMQCFNRNLSFSAVDIDRMIGERPRQIAAYLKEITACFEKNIFQPLPVKVFDADCISDAFETINNNAYIGKLVVDFEDQEIEVVSSANSTPDESTWLVTGGTKGLGLAIADWLSRIGIKNIVLAARNSLTDECRQTVEAMRKRGTTVWPEHTDIAEEKQVKALLQKIKTKMPPLKGIVHCAMVLDDGLLADMTAERFEKVLRPKVDGALHLHNHTHNEKLDHFICISSISSLIGNPGQANYIAANSFLDAFAHYRNSKGLPASVINLGALAETGVVSRSKNIEIMLNSAGITGLSTEKVLQAISYLIKEKPVQAGFFNINWKIWSSANPKAKRTSLFRHLNLQKNKEQLPDKWSELINLLTPMNSEERYGYIRQLLLDALSEVLKMPQTAIDPEKGINLLGIDSVMVVELITVIKKNVGVNMLPMEFLTGPSVNHLTGVIIDKLPVLKQEEVIA